MNATSLPSRFPVGTRYVIEGRRGKSGKLRIVSRQVILPSGKSFDLKTTSFERARKPRAKRQAAVKG